MANRKSIQGGVIAAAISPRQAGEYSIDLAASLELTDFLYERGVDGIALLGSTGEFVHFMLEDRARMLDFAVKRSRLPLLVNVSHSTLDGAIYLGQEAAASGVAAVMLMPPYYYRYDQESVRAFCLRFAEVVAKEVPVYLYNIPVFTSEIALETANSLLSSGLFSGIKDSSGTWGYLDGLLQARGDRTFHIFTGDERLFPRLRGAGGDGVVSGIACAIPELVVRLHRAIRDHDEPMQTRLTGRIEEFLVWFFKFPAPVAIKEAMRLRKVKSGALAAPLGPEGTRTLAEFGAWFQGWLREVVKECR